jgi:hypothetical protein
LKAVTPNLYLVQPQSAQQQLVFNTFHKHLSAVQLSCGNGNENYWLYHLSKIKKELLPKVSLTAPA